MIKVWQFILSIFNTIMSYYPGTLPTGLQEFVSWQDSILAMSKVPDNDSTRFASAVMVLHLDSTTDRKPKRYFIKALNKAAANEVANATIMALKAKQQAAQAAAKAVQDSTSTTGTTNEVAQGSETQKTAG